MNTESLVVIRTESKIELSIYIHIFGADEVTSQRLLSIKICSVRIKFCGQSGNGNGCSR
jgi:hypothetical protein